MEYFAKLSDLERKYQDALEAISAAYRTKAKFKEIAALDKAAQEAHAELEAHEKKRPK